jgi:hypothetical protein
VKTNWAYWRLGKAYQAFCLVSSYLSMCRRYSEQTCDLKSSFHLYREYTDVPAEGQGLAVKDGTATSVWTALSGVSPQAGKRPRNGSVGSAETVATRSQVPLRCGSFWYACAGHGARGLDQSTGRFARLDVARRARRAEGRGRDRRTKDTAGRSHVRESSRSSPFV